MARTEFTRLPRPLLQLCVLGAIGLGFTLGPRGPIAEAGGGQCVDEDACTFRKPNVMFIVEYSTQMNAVFDDDVTYWDAAAAGVQTITQPGSYLSDHTHLALMRYGHDPDPDAPGTSIVDDNSGIVDGQALDVAWDGDDDVYFTCNGQAMFNALGSVDAPLQGELAGIGGWTRGALEAANVEIAQTRADHPDDLDERIYLNVVVGLGRWTDADGQQVLGPAQQDPTLTAGPTFDDEGVRTFVFNFDAGDPAWRDAADELADAGGTNAALQVEAADEVVDAAEELVGGIVEDAIAPACTGGLPRVMMLVDASSSMLNVDQGLAPAPMGEGNWDHVREALTGVDGIFEFEVSEDVALADVTHIGLASWGSPNEEKVLVQYGPCVDENVAWALDPNTSCEAPGCDDPWGGPPITWTFADGNEDPPGFVVPTHSHMPACGGFEGQGCSGSGTYTHLGLQLIHQNQQQYQADGLQPDALYPTTADTRYVNVLITDGQYTGWATDAQVQGAFEAIFAEGITTRVIGYGDGVASPAAMAQLENMAGWGSGGMHGANIANNQAELEEALYDIFADLEYDPCCAFVDCKVSPEPVAIDPDPVPPPGDGDGDEGGDTGTDTGGDGDGDATDTSDGDGDGDGAGDGDGEASTGDGDGEGDSESASSGSASDSDDETATSAGSEESGSEGGAPVDEAGEGGCACSSSTDTEGTGSVAFTLLAFVGWRRRRVTRRCDR